jgi:hypothetical protein
MACDSESRQHCNTPALTFALNPSDSSIFTVLTLTDPEPRHGRCRCWHEIPSFVTSSHGFAHWSSQITTSTRCAFRLHFWCCCSLRPRWICDTREMSFELTARVADSLTCHCVRAVRSGNVAMNFCSRKPFGKQKTIIYRTSAKDGSCDGNGTFNQLSWLSADSCWHMLPTTRNCVCLVCISILTVQI